MVRKALVIVDMQNDFAHPEGSLFVPSSRRAIPVLRSLLERARRARAPVAFTQDHHRPREPHHFRLWPKHCVRGTWGAEVVEELAPRPGEHVARKNAYTGFHRTGLDRWLRARRVGTLVLGGVCTNICVLHTAADAALRDYRVVVPREATGALSAFEQTYGLKHMESILKAEVVSHREVRFP